MLDKAGLLQVVDLTGFKVTNQMVLRMARQWKHLRHLRLRAYGISYQSIDRLLRLCHNLNVVELEFCWIYPEETQLLQQNFPHVTLEIRNRFRPCQEIESEIRDLIIERGNC